MKNLFPFLSLIVFLSCEVGEDFVPDNPIDPINPDYVKPEITFISSPSEGEIIKEAEYTFTWQGNRDGMLYRYAFDNNWSDWVEEQTSASIKYMDEGHHRFDIQSKYSNEDTSTIASIQFIVDAITGPSLLLYPRSSKVNIDEMIALSLNAEEVTNLSGAEIQLSYDAAAIDIVAISKGEIFNELGETLFIEDHSLSGSITISTAVWGQELPSASGTHSLAIIQLRLKKPGNTSIEISNSSTLRDSNNQSITINQLIGGVIESN